jgi:hypothetical protein
LVKLHTMRKLVHNIKEPNPLNFYNMRQVDVLPPHFEVITTPMTYNINDSIANWIKRNLKGRFYIGQGVVINSSSQIETVIKIAFEDPKEASYFALACPHLKYQ